MIAIDLILAGLLLVTIFYASLLNKKIQALQENRTEIEKLLSTLHQGIDKAEEGANRLKISSSQSEYVIQNQIKKANLLKSDLEHFCKKADQTLDKLEERITEAKTFAESSRRFDDKEIKTRNKNPIKPILNLQTLR